MKATRAAIAATMLLGIGAFVACHSKPPTDITFAEYGGPYSSKPDFAEVEHKYPLTPAQLMNLTPQNIKAFDQEKVDQIYARLTAGPIPDGAYDGDLFFPKGLSGRSRLSEVLGGVKGQLASLELTKLTLLGKALWKGKVFYRNERVLRNRIDHLELLSEFFPQPGEESQVRDLATHGHTDQLYFPAKLYCGQSLLDSRRESIIIDYAFTDEIEGYHEIPDKLAGREGLLVRDEIRMVRPGFYLGRAYLSESFALNFTVYNVAAAQAGSADFASTGKTTEDCWTGPQRMAAAQ